MARIADQKTIGLRIARKRSDRSISQEKFAELLGISRNTLGSIERGETPASLATLRHLFEYTDMTPNQLFLIEEAQSDGDSFAQLFTDLEPNEAKELLNSAECMKIGIIAKRERQI